MFADFISQLVLATVCGKSNQSHSQKHPPCCGIEQLKDIIHRLIGTTKLLTNCQLEKKINKCELEQIVEQKLKTLIEFYILALSPFQKPAVIQGVTLPVCW